MNNNGAIQVIDGTLMVRRRFSIETEAFEKLLNKSKDSGLCISAIVNRLILTHLN